LTFDLNTANSNQKTQTNLNLPGTLTVSECEMSAFDPFGVKNLVIKGKSQPKECGPDPVAILLETESGTKTVWAEFPRDALRAASGYADTRLKPPKHQPYELPRFITLPKGSVNEEALRRVLQYIKLVAPVKPDFQGKKEFFPNDRKDPRDSITLKVGIHLALKFLEMKKPFDFHPLLHDSITTHASQRILTPEEMIKVYTTFKDTDQKLINKMLSKFVNTAHAASTGRVVAENPQFGYQYELYFHNAGMLDLNNQIRNMHNGLKRREAREAAAAPAAYAASTSNPYATFASYSQTPVPMPISVHVATPMMTAMPLTGTAYQPQYQQQQSIAQQTPFGGANNSGQFDDEAVRPPHP
jgi:hypothetical protein